MRAVAALLLAFTAATAAALEPLEVKFQLRGYFMADSSLKDPKALGGFAPSDNAPRRLDRPVAPGVLTLTALPDETVAFDGKRGFRVILANATRTTAVFHASDSRINIIREARDRQGRWRPVEYLPSSWCGNSYHRIFLKVGHYWSFAAPEFRGSFRTKMRFVLEQEGLTLRSNEFEGWIHPEQFEQKEGHMATNIMDPYN